MSKKGVIIILSAITFAGVFAMLMPATQVRALNGNFADRMQAHASAAAQIQTNELSRIITRGNNMIQVRISALSALLTRIQNDKRLTSDEKTLFESDINTTITNLQTLKTKLDADTDATTARADVKSIVTSYRVFMVFEPKERITIVIDNLQTASTNIGTIITKIQGLLNTLKSEGKDTTAAQNALNDASTQLTAINGLLSTDKTLIANATISTSNPESVFSQVKNDMLTVRGDVEKIRTDFLTIRSSLKTSPSSISSSPSVSPTGPSTTP